MDLCKTSSHFVLFVFLCLLYGSTHESAADRYSLLAFKSKISNDPLGVFNSWNESTDFCSWSGVTCGKRHRNRVTKLDLQSQQLEGTLSPHIGNLSFLKMLNLRNNSFNLKIPQGLGSLFRLQILYLDNNSFSGEIPSNISRCSNLNLLSLSGNNLGGELPTEIGILSKLQYLNLSGNNFVGKIPPSFGNLSSLSLISGTYNNLHGSVPSTFSQLKDLQALAFDGNNLSGPIPESIFNLSSLTFLSFRENKLSGSLPGNIGLTLPNLESLFLDANQFNGPIPISIANLTFLRDVSISKNRLTGKIPHLGSLRDLRSLTLSENDLGTGENDDFNFMSSLLNCTSLEALLINHNNFFGIVMPEFLSNFSKQITRLSFGRNQIRGNIPSEIGNLINLEVLDMETNLLSGTIPASVGKLQNLHRLSLYENKLFGQVPSAIGNLSSLGLLDLSLNYLQGSIPPSIGGCIDLQAISLSRNDLNGTIPKELLHISSLIFIDLSENILTGSLPLEVGNLVHLGELDVSENNLFGEIPETLGSCTSLKTLLMAGNFFHGKIPSSLESLRGLQFLDLSRNNLSGQVPRYLINFDFLNLNLAWNDFEGQLPDQGVFNNLTAIFVRGNKKLCSRKVELSLPSCTPRRFDVKPSKRAKLKLIISLISVIVGMILASVFKLIYMSRKKRKLSTSIVSSIPQVTYDDLRKATDEFSSHNLIGVGGVGSVYKGFLGHESSIVAVKVLNLKKHGATKSFMTECATFQNIVHRNLVKIISACSSVDMEGNDFRALVYEFMINGNLENWLYPDHTNKPDEQKYLTFVQRFNIVVDVANALDYTHNECQTPIVHCDLKPNNILLDEDMMARVGDFGQARLCQFPSTQSSYIAVRGSIGYSAPEYGMGNEVSTYGDIYSFGILLLEIFTGKRPTDCMFKDGLDLHKFAMMALPERVMFIADPIQFQNDDQFRSYKFWNCFISIIKLGVACSVETPKERMNIKKVVEELVHIKCSLLQMGIYFEGDMTMA